MVHAANVGRRRFATGCLCACLATGAVSAPDAAALLAASDAIRNPSHPYRVVISLAEYEKGKQVNTMVMVSFARMNEKTGQFATLLRFTQPARDAGKVMLKNGADLWFFDPSTTATVQISPQQRLIGQAANGDVLTVNFARDYAAEKVGEEQITDGERKPRRSVRLNLTAKGPEAAYAAIGLWLDADTSAPLKAQFFADSGRLLKTVYYRRYQTTLGRDRPTEAVIIDGLEPTSVTIVRFSDYAARDVPTAWLQRDYMPRFTGE